MSKALESALRAVARMKGDSTVSAAELRKVLAVALGKQPGDDDGEDDVSDQDKRRH